MKEQPTEEQLQSELTRLRADTEQVRRRAKELTCRTSKLYRAIEDLRPESPRALKT